MIDYNKLRGFVKNKHLGHQFAGFDHIERVYNLCMQLAEGLNVDMEVLKVAAYLHDIAVPVYGPDMHSIRVQEVIGDLLNEIDVPEDKHEHIFEVIKTHTRYTDWNPNTIEAKILRDADGIDYIGAVGILRGVLRDYHRNVYTGNINEEASKMITGLIEKVENTFCTEKAKILVQERIEFIKEYLKVLGKEITSNDDGGGL